MVTRQQFFDACDALAKAQVLEAQKAAAGEAVLAEWWRAAEPRWRQLSTVLDQAEREDWVRAAVWFDLWRDARRVGAAPGTVDTHAPSPATPEDATAKRRMATSPALHRVQTSAPVSV